MHEEQESHKATEAASERGSAELNDGLGDADIKIGEHCWALLDGALLVVLKTDEGSYEVCGAWECGVGAHRLQILSIIPRPVGHEITKLYYA